MKTERLIVNHVCVDASEITVGATNLARWQWDVDDGCSGADARTLVWVTLKDSGPGAVVADFDELTLILLPSLRTRWRLAHEVLASSRPDDRPSPG